MDIFQHIKASQEATSTAPYAVPAVLVTKLFFYNGLIRKKATA